MTATFEITAPRRARAELKPLTVDEPRWPRMLRWQGWRRHRLVEMALLVVIGAALFWDRWALCKQFLFRYTDEDQAVMWNAAHELLNGRLREPCFFGQDYNSCLEGYLAAPLVGMNVPYHVAVPLVTVILGLLPFVVMAAVAWRRGQTLTAGAALLVPLIMPVRYGMMTGIARGFVTGIAVGIVPAVLWLVPGMRRGERAEPALARAGGGVRGLRRHWAAVRYFAAAALAIVAVQLNPNCLILLAPAGIYAVLTSWREWKFWAFSVAGAVAAAPYPLYVYQFYHITHPDYVAYLRGVEYQWGFTYYRDLLATYIAPAHGASPILKDLVPFPVSGEQAAWFIVMAFGVVAGLLLLRGQSAGLAAAFTGGFVTIASFGYERVRTYNGNNSASFPYARMYLAIPVLFVWLLVVAGRQPWPRIARSAGGIGARWVTRGVLAGLVLAAVQAYSVKRGQLPGVLAAEAQEAQVCPPIPVESLYAIAHEVQRVAAEQHADLLLVGGADKHLAYALPALTGVETLYITPMLFERRTWRFNEERTARHSAVLLITLNDPAAVRVGGGVTVKVDSAGETMDYEAAPDPGPGNGGRGSGFGGFGAPAGRGRAAADRSGGGGFGVAAGSGAAAGAGGMAGAGRGGRGGRGRGGSSFVRETPAMLEQAHAISIPPILMMRVNGKSVYDVPSIRSQLPAWVTPAAGGPHPEPQVQRPPWRGR